MDNIILIGFMGCGKTSVGIRLSYRMKRAMTDTDRLIERQEGRTVPDIFERFGEEAFRQMETECLKRLRCEKECGIISTGGGLPVRRANRALLKELGTVVFLRVGAETVCERLKGDTSRPLLTGENPEGKVSTLLRERTPVYESVADYIIDTEGKDPERIVDEILQLKKIGGNENESAGD